MSQPPGRCWKLSVAVVGLAVAGLCIGLWLKRAGEGSPQLTVSPSKKDHHAGTPSFTTSPVASSAQPQSHTAAFLPNGALPLSPPRVLASRLTPLVTPAALKEGGETKGKTPPTIPLEVANGKLVEKRESAPNAQGYTRRVSIYETAFKYPFLRVEEQWMKDGQGKEVVLARAVMVADHFVVRLQKGSTEQQLKEHLAALGLTIRRQLPKSAFYIAALPSPDIAAYDKALEVLSTGKGPAAYGEPDFIARTNADPVIPTDPSFSQLWGLHNTGQTSGVVDADIDAPEAWSITTGSSAVTVAVIDSGVDYTHPDLAANIWTNPGEIAGNGLDDDDNGYIDDIHGYDFNNDDANPQDDNGHGSHVAGTIGAVGGNNTGVVGVCHTVRIIALKFLGADGNGALSDAVEAINYATNAQVLLSSNSWSGGGYTQSLKDVIDDAGAEGIGCICAAGNSTTNNDAVPSYPSSYDSPNVIAVAATNASDMRAVFSSFGATTVDLAAPGESIYSTTKDGGYAIMDGTSMATPHVSGACALLKAANPALSFTAIKQALLLQTDPLPTLAGRCLTGGRLNVANALLPATEAFLDLADVTVLDDQVSGAAGNGDGIVSPGESFTLVLGIKNHGALLSPGLVGVLSLRVPDANITLTQVNANYGDIASGATVTNALVPFVISVAANTPTPTDVPLRLTLTDSASRVWTEDFMLHVYTVATVSGQVTRVTGGTPVEGATIKLVGTVNKTVTTDASGQYSAIVVDGEYTVQALGTGFIPSELQTVTLPPSVANVNFVLGYSDLQLSPTTLTQTQFVNELKTQTLVLENHGDQPLTYRLDEVPAPSIQSTSVKMGQPYVPPARPLSQKLRRAQEGFSQMIVPATLNAAAHVDPTVTATLPFSDGFESGNYDRWFDGWGNGTREVVTTTAARGTHSFHFHHDGPPDHLTGIYQQFDWGTQPGYVSFYVRPPADDLATSYFVLGDIYFIWLADFIWFFANDNGRFYINDDVGGNQAVTYLANQWYHVEFRDIDWTARTFDYYVDGALVQADIPFRNPDVATSCQLVFAYNYSEDTDVWYDDVVIAKDALAWFSLSQKTGTIPPGGSQSIAVTFDASGLQPSTYTGQVSVSSNDPGSPEVTIPVTMQVLPPEPPTFSPTGGNFTNPVSVTLSANPSSATIRYTTDGTAPNATSRSMASGSALTLGHTTTLKAVAAIADVFSTVSTSIFAFADTDEDGLPDWWEALQPGGSPTASNPAADDDHDGMTTMDEYVAGTNPGQPDRFEAGVSSSTEGTTIQWPSQADRFYTVEASEDLESWTTVSGPTPGTGDPMAFQDTAAPAPMLRFYRVQVSLP